MSSNSFINKFISNNKNFNLSKTNSNIVRLSENIIDINPVPIYIKPEITDKELINTEMEIIASYLKEENLYVNKNQDNNKEFGIFTSQNAYVPYNNILGMENMYIELIKQKIFQGINELITTIYNYQGKYEYKILNSWIQKYRDGVFLSPHNHVSNNRIINNVYTNHKVFSVGYYIDDGDPDISQSYSGVISFLTTNNNLYHIRPKTGTLLIWEEYLIHLVNPFYSKSNKERFILSTNILVEW